VFRGVLDKSGAIRDFSVIFPVRLREFATISLQSRGLPAWERLSGKWTDRRRSSRDISDGKRRTAQQTLLLTYNNNCLTQFGP